MGKSEALNVLNNKGLRAAFSGDGIPTVYVPETVSVRGTAENVKKIFTDCGYEQSFGIRRGQPAVDIKI